MKLLCDEAVERPIVEGLRSEGHDVLYVAELSPSIPDEEVLDLAASEEAVLVTADKDFGELVYRQGRTHHGVLLIRLHGLGPEEKGRVTALAVAEHGSELVGSFSVVEKDRIRIRKRRVQ